MPMITVQLVKGRSKEQKKELAQAITEATISIMNARRERVSVLFEEFEADDLVIGGELFSEKYPASSK